MKETENPKKNIEKKTNFESARTPANARETSIWRNVFWGVALKARVYKHDARRKLRTPGPASTQRTAHASTAGALVLRAGLLDLERAPAVHGTIPAHRSARPRGVGEPHEREPLEGAVSLRGGVALGERPGLSDVLAELAGGELKRDVFDVQARLALEGGRVRGRGLGRGRAHRKRSRRGPGVGGRTSKTKKGEVLDGLEVVSSDVFLRDGQDDFTLRGTKAANAIRTCEHNLYVLWEMFEQDRAEQNKTGYEVSWVMLEQDLTEKNKT